jgi:hypothetical protein
VEIRCRTLSPPTWPLRAARALAAVLLASCAVRANADPPGETALSVAQLAALQPAKGTFTVEGWVAFRHPCPPCPEGAYCKLCFGDAIWLSDERPGTEKAVRQPPRELAVVRMEASQIALFAEGERCRLRVRASRDRTTNAATNDLRLVEILSLGHITTAAWTTAGLLLTVFMISVVIAGACPPGRNKPRPSSVHPASGKFVDLSKRFRLDSRGFRRSSEKQPTCR